MIATKPGTLYILATPIGNRNDITLRALMTLQAVQLVLAEDTRTAHRLLSLYPDRTFDVHVARLDEHLGPARLLNLVDQIEQGADAALVSEAGTPGISDPGGRFIAECRTRGIKVVPIPGVSALTAILSVADFATEPVTFYGFLPKKKGRESTLRSLKRSTGKYGVAAAVLYESPERIVRTLGDLAALLGGESHVVVGRELTKVHEELFYGTVSEALKHFAKPKGEFTILVQLSE